MQRQGFTPDQTGKMPAAALTPEFWLLDSFAANLELKCPMYNPK